MSGCPSLGLNEVFEPRAEDAWVGVLDGDCQGKRGSSQALFNLGKRTHNVDLRKVYEWSDGWQAKGREEVFAHFLRLVAPVTEVRRTRWFFMQQEADTWHFLP